MAGKSEKLETPEYKERLLTFSERLKEQREKLKITQNKLASLIGLSSHSVISRWEAVCDDKRGGEYVSAGAVAREMPDVNDLLKLCDVFDCEIAYLIGIQDKPKREQTDINHTIGLSEAAIKALSNTALTVPCETEELEQKTINIGVVSRRSATISYQKIINLLLSNQHGRKVLKLLAAYCFAALDNDDLKSEDIPAFVFPWDKSDSGIPDVYASTLPEEVLREALLYGVINEMGKLRAEQQEENIDQIKRKRKSRKLEE